MLQLNYFEAPTPPLADLLGPAEALATAGRGLVLAAVESGSLSYVYVSHPSIL